MRVRASGYKRPPSWYKPSFCPVGPAGQKQFGRVLPLNPARVLATGAAFNCSFRRFWTLLLAEVFASLVAGGAAFAAGVVGNFRPFGFFAQAHAAAPGYAPVATDEANQGLRRPLVRPNTDVALGEPIAFV